MGVLVSVTLSVVSAAVKVTLWATVSVTVKETCPLALDESVEGSVTLAAHGEGVHDVGVRLTALPSTGTEPVPSSVTVTVEMSTPSATAVPGEAITVERVGSGVVATAGAEPSPAGVPLSVLLGAMKKGVDHRCGWVKSPWLFPM